MYSITFNFHSRLAKFIGTRVTNDVMFIVKLWGC